MNTIGQNLQQGLDFAGRGLFGPAFINVCAAIGQTADKAFENMSSAEPGYQRFVNSSWRFISFTGMSSDDTLPPDIPDHLRRFVPSLDGPDGAKNIVNFAVRQGVLMRAFPAQITFDDIRKFSFAKDKLVFPQSLVYALAGSVIIHPSNKNESIPDNYWLKIWDFKMFISELWGRTDIAERIMDLYKK